MVERLSLGSFGFDDGRMLDEGAHTGWFFSDLSDWEGLPEAKGDLLPRPVSHGSFQPGAVFREIAVPSFIAKYVGADAAEASAAVRSFVGECGRGGLRSMTVVDDDGLELSRMVRVKRVEHSARRGGSRVRSVTVYAEAPDPLRYGPLSSGSTGVPTPGVGIADPLHDAVQEGEPGNLGRVQITNGGTAQTWPRLVVSGGLGAGVQVQCIESGRVLRFERMIPDGSFVVFDSRTGRVLLDGVSDATGFLTVDEWSSIPAGSACTFQFVPLGAVVGSPSLMVEAAPAYF